MHDWLKEAYPFFPDVSPCTIYNTVMEVRAEANIPNSSIALSFPSGEDVSIVPCIIVKFDAKLTEKQFYIKT